MKEKKELIIIFIIVFTITMFSWGLYGYFLSSIRIYEYKTDETKTNEYPVIYDTNDELLENIEEKYPDFYDKLKRDKKILGYDMTVIPGMDATKTLRIKDGKIVICTSMTPQGLAVTDKYMFISAYCYTHKHNSVIYVIDKKTGNFIKEIVLDSTSHVGGLAYDTVNHNLWITEYKNGKSYVGSISLSSIENYKISENNRLKYENFVCLKNIKRASFMTYTDNHLLIGYFSLTKHGYFKLYEIDKTGNLNSEDIITKKIDSQIQGIAYSNDYLVLSKSYGPFDSKLLIFDNVLSSDYNRKFIDESSLMSIPLPEKMEQIYIYENKLYILFESSSFTYRFTSTNHIDRVIGLILEN